MAIMEDDERYSAMYSTTNLQRCSYRILQQTAKALGLPSNVKKVCLIQLINTKKYGTPEVADALVKQVRLERKQLSLDRKKAKRKKKQHVQQSTEISSTSQCKSPPITNTPKRVGHILIRYSPELHSPIKHHRRAPARTFPLTGSDRVLRSFNRIKKPSYLINHALTEMFESSSSEEIKETRVNIVSKEKYQEVNRTYVKKSVDEWKGGGEVMHVSRSVNTSPMLARRQRRISGIYPLHPAEVRPNVAVRRADGTLSKLNAIIQKPSTQQNSNYEQETTDSRNINMQLLSIEPDETSSTSQNLTEFTQNLECREPNITFTDTPHNNMSFTSSSEEINIPNTYKENNGGFAVYYHKKIRAEQVRSLRREAVRSVEECRLPKINEVFSKFNSMYCRDVTQPIYVQVDNEVENAPNPPYIPDPRVQYQGSSILEKLYNLKGVLINQPLLQISTTSNTRTVYSTPIISTAKAQPSANEMHNIYNNASSRDSQPYLTDEELPRVHEFFRNFQCDEDGIHDISTEDFRRSSSSITSQELGANVTIPEMVEDALELISQDGDYMERMGMDIRMQCILCNWAGPKIILEYHIRKDHADEIIQCESMEWCTTYTLGRLSSCRLWVSQVLEYRAALYVLSAKYEDPDCFMAALSTLSSDPESPKSGSMTIYNKVTGEPFTWRGDIIQLPPSMPYDNDPHCFKLELSKMNLLPNSANLRLLNRELVINSLSKVVVGHPELDNIHISLIVKIFD